MIEIRKLKAADLDNYLSALAGVLLDCVAGGASVSFMASVTQSEAEALFCGLRGAIAEGNCILLAAFDGSELLGTVQVHAAGPPNQTHRADVTKLLVLRSARRRGIATKLMDSAEQAARRVGKSLLVLDTTTGSDAERLYGKLGWTKAGIIPNYAQLPDGRLSDTTIFWKAIYGGRPSD